MSFVTTLSGTCVTFADKDRPQVYPGGETFTAANLFLEKTGAIHAESQVEHICEPTHTFIDGPDRLGSEVFDRMNLCLFRLLNAVSRNQRDLQILGFSRGACEAILVSHEFDRIKKLFDGYSEDQIETCIEEIEAKFKENIVGGLKIQLSNKAEEATFFSADNLKAIKRNISNANISLFLIDPVPGGSYLGIDPLVKQVNAATSCLSDAIGLKKRTIPSIKWDDPLLYELPDCVYQLQQFVYENERTRCFKPIVPVKRKGMKYYSVQTLPGHHGTGSGNPYVQLGISAHPDDVDPNKTIGVQDYIFSVLIKFLQSKGHTFDTSNYPAHFQRLKDIADKILACDESAYNEHIIKLKENILSNLESYQRFEKTHYGLGLEHGDSSPRHGNGSSRIIHHCSNENFNLCDVIPNGRTPEFLDWEHMELVMQSLLKGPFNHLDPITCIRSLKEAMQNKAPHFKELQKGLLTNIINGLSCEFIAENLNLSAEQIPLFLVELNSLMGELKRFDEAEHQSHFKIAENALITSLRKKIVRFYENPIEIIQKKFQKDIQSLKELLSGPSIQSSEYEGVRTAFNALNAKGKIQSLPKLSESPFNAQILEIFSRWSPDQIERNNQSVLPKLCQNYKKLLELEKLILSFREKGDIYTSTKFEGIALDFKVIRTNILETMRRFKIPLDEVYRCFKDQKAYNHFSQWLFDKYPDVEGSIMRSPLHELSVRLERAKNQDLLSIRQVQASDFYATISTKNYPHNKKVYYEENMAHIKDKLSKLVKTNSELNASLEEAIRLQQFVIDNKKILQSLVKKARTTYSVFPGYLVELEQQQKTLNEIEETAIHRLRVIDEEKAKIKELYTQGKKLIRTLPEYESIDAKNARLLSAIAALKEQVSETKSLGDDSIWYQTKIDRLNSIIEEEESEDFETYLQKMIDRVSRIETHERPQMIHALHEKCHQLAELKQEATNLQNKLSKLNQIYTSCPVPLIELDQQLPDFPEQPDIAVLNNFHERTMELQRVIEAYTILNQELKNETKWQLIDDKISQYNATIENLQQRQSTLQSHIERITSNANSFYENWLQQLIKTTLDYQTHLNAQHSSEQLTHKKEIIASLLNRLNTLNQPSYVKIHQFQQCLGQFENELTLHRDPDWKRYLGLIAKSMFIFTLLVGAIVAALTPCLALGIGIAVASLFSMGATVYKKQSFENWSLFSSKGEMFVETVKIEPVWEGGL